MHFNVDKTEEVIFSHKTFKLTHLPLYLGPEVIATTSEHKHRLNTCGSLRSTLRNPCFALDIDGMNSKILCSLRLYGCSQLDNVTNRMILDDSISYINKTKRFQ